MAKALSSDGGGGTRRSGAGAGVGSAGADAGARPARRMTRASTPIASASCETTISRRTSSEIDATIGATLPQRRGARLGGAVGPEPDLVDEVLDGRLRTLDQLLERGGALPPGEGVRILAVGQRDDAGVHAGRGQEGDGAQRGRPPGAIAVEAEDDVRGEAAEDLDLVGGERRAERRHGLGEAAWCSAMTSKFPSTTRARPLRANAGRAACRPKSRCDFL
jgi:hypothetical protein